MELLTGKAREHFEVWLNKNHTDTVLGCPCSEACACLNDNFWDLPELIQYVYIQEWLDGVGIIAETEHLEPLTQYTGKAKDINSKLREDIGLFKTRPEARIAAISKATDIYNAKHQ